MVSFFYEISPEFQALLAGTCTFLLTTLGSATIFLFNKISNKAMNIMLAVSAGIMLSSSFFSLLSPSIEYASLLNFNSVIICSIGLIVGSLLLYFLDKIDSNHNNKSLILSITIHNIPEGMAIGLAFGSVMLGSSFSTLSAISLAIGIGIQNFPEGSAISFPLYHSGCSKFKSFLIGSLSAIVEPLAAFFGAILVTKVTIILPFLLAVAAGAMFYAITSELIPESFNNKNKEVMAVFFVFGFILMMILDLSFS